MNTMLWSFLAVFFSGWLYIDAAYRGPQWQRLLFKPVTLLLLLAWAWQSPNFHASGYLIPLGLLATLAGDILLLSPQKPTLYASGAYFLCHLLYTISFLTTMPLSFFWPVPLLLLIIGIIFAAVVQAPLNTLRWPVLTFITMTLVMVWLPAEQYYLRPTHYLFSLFAGTVLLLISHMCWIFSQARRRFYADSAIIAACYFGGHFMIVRSLWLFG